MMTTMYRLTFVVAALVLQFIWASTVQGQQGIVYNTRVSLGYDGSEADGDSYYSTISKNGRFVVFASDATNLVPNDTNGKTDVFVFDLETGIMERVSVASNGIEGNGASGYDDLLDISNDGRYVVFSSEATNLVTGDNNTDCQRFYWDNGEEVAVNFNCPDIFVKDRLTNEMKLISASSEGVYGNGTSGVPSVSADGRYVVFGSSADNLVEGDTNECSDIFVHNLETGETKRVSVASDGTQANETSLIGQISTDGLYVVFESLASNLSSEDTDDQLDVYVHNLRTGETSLVSVGLPENGEERYSLVADISASGRYVSFLSGGTTFPEGIRQIYRRDLQEQETEIVSVSVSGSKGNRGSLWSSISANGRWIAFTSRADNLVEGIVNCDGCGQVYLKDMSTGEVALLTRVLNNYVKTRSGIASISDDGSRVVFDSTSSELVLGDTNNHCDIFVYGWKSTPIYSVNLPSVFR